MSTCCTTTRGLSFLRDFAEEARRSLDTASREQEKRQREANDDRGRKAEDLAERARGQVRDLLGSKNRDALRQLMRRERLAFRDLLQPPGGLKLVFEEADAARKAKAERFLRELGADPARLSAIGQSFQRELQGILSPSEARVVPGANLAMNFEEWKLLSPLHEVALPWGVLAEDPTESPHRWFLFRPPFPGSQTGFVPVASSNFAVDAQHILSAAEGLVGIEARMDNGDADDFDYASVDAFTQVGFVFEPPTTGLVEVIIDAQCANGTHDLRTEEEWGWSNSNTGQSNHLMLNVLHPNVPEPSFAEMSSMHVEASGDSTTHRENLTRGQHYFAHLFSAGPVPAGQPVLVLAGTRTFDISGTNDVEIHSASSFHWFISSVEVRISP
jgi:hypothetical protein